MSDVLLVFQPSSVAPTGATDELVIVDTSAHGMNDPYSAPPERLDLNRHARRARAAAERRAQSRQRAARRRLP